MAPQDMHKDHVGAKEAPQLHSHDRPHLLVLSSPDGGDLLDSIEDLCDSFMDGEVDLSVAARQLSAKSVRHVHRAFTVTKDTDIDSDDFVCGSLEDASNLVPPRVSLLFTGQGAQWPQMGQQLLAVFPIARGVMKELDEALQELADPPSWSIIEELTAPRTVEDYGRPDIAQTMTTAIQLALVAIYRHWGIIFGTVIGHSSGEIAAACAAGLLTRREAIAAAYYCGWAAMHCAERPSVSTGMLAAAIDARSADAIRTGEGGMDDVAIACYNGPQAVTFSGPLPTLQRLRAILTEQGRQTSLLNNPVAYHHPDLMASIAQTYESKLSRVLASGDERRDQDQTGGVVSMLSTVTTEQLTVAADAAYWRRNILSPVRFDETLTKALEGADAPDVVIEVGPAGSLAGAVADIKAKTGSSMSYHKSMNRGKAPINPMFQTAGGLFLAGGEVDIAVVNS